MSLRKNFWNVHHSQLLFYSPIGLELWTHFCSPICILSHAAWITDEMSLNEQIIFVVSQSYLKVINLKPKGLILAVRNSLIYRQYLHKSYEPLTDKVTQMMNSHAKWFWSFSMSYWNEAVEAISTGCALWWVSALQQICPIWEFITWIHFISIII